MAFASTSARESESPLTAQPLAIAGRIAQLFITLVLASGTFLDAPTATAGRTGSTSGSSRDPVCDVPTAGEASSVEGIVSFDQKMLRFEEFGTQTLNHSLGSKGEQKALPAPETAYGFPSGGKLDEFIGKPLHPFPLRDTNQGIANPWQSVIEATHTGPLTPLPGKTLSSFADGRPAGPQFGHQRWQEFMPQTYFETVVTGSRINNGARDSLQSHFYQFGEFGPGSDLKSGTSDDGLYHSVYEYSGEVHSSSPHAAAADSKTGLVHMSLHGTTKGLPISLHPELAVQDSQSLWTFDGTLPPKLLMARVGQPLLFRNNNALPIKFESNRGFGNHFITTHEHNGHNPAESDGFAQAYFLPGQFYDYHWPMALAGHDTINTDRSDDGAAIACDPGEWVTVYVPGYGDTIKEKLASFAQRQEICPPNGRVNISGDSRETMSTHWFHDHMLDFTAQNVYKGNAAMMNYYSALDRGNECWNDGVNLRFPSGCGQKYSLPKDDIGAPQQSKRTWGVRDYDIQLALASKAWGQDTSTYPGTTMVTGKNALGEDIVEDQLWFAPFNAKGFVGDRMTVNWLYHPYLDVRARRYRFRVLNADVSRFMRLALVVARDGNQGEFTGERSGVSYDRVPFHMIANDGNIMEHAVPHDGSMDLDYDGDLSDHHGVLPTISIAERYDIVVDFGAYKTGSKIYLVNLLEHTDGRGPNREIPLAQVLDGTHDSCDSAVGKFMEIRVHPFSGKDLSMNPVDYIPGRKTMIPLPALSEEEIRDAVHHTFLFGSGGLTDSRPRNLATNFYPSPSGKVWVEGENGKDEGGEFPFIRVEQPSSDNPLQDMVEECIAYDLEETDEHLLHLGLTFNDYMNGVPRFSIGDKESSILPFHPDKAWGISTDRGISLTTDMHRLSVAPVRGGLEIWHFENEGAMWSHNVHIHFEEGRILRRDGKAPPEWEKWARKDVYRIGSMDDSGASVDIAIRFREFAGSYMSHCHNTTHEDHAMLLRFDVENPGQLQAFLTPEPQWNGTSYSQSHEERKATQRSDSHGDVLGKRAFNQDDIAAMLCPPGATGGCPGAISASSVAHQSQALCDADGNGQVDALDLLQIIREPGTKEDGSPLIDWGTCASKCTHRGCSPVARGNGRCGLLGIEGLLVLLPLAMRRRREGR